MYGEDSVWFSLFPCEEQGWMVLFTLCNLQSAIGGVYCTEDGECELEISCGYVKKYLKKKDL